MKQSLFLRGGVWQAKIQLDGWPREKRVSLHTTDKRLARTKLVLLVTEAEKEAAGLLPPQSVRLAHSRGFLEHLEAFLSDLSVRGKAPRTIKSYRCILRRLCADCGWTLLSDVSVRSFCEWRADAGLHGETANDYLSALSRFFNWLKRQRCVLENPVEFVERVDTRATVRDFRRSLTEEEVTRLLQNTPQPRRVIYRLVLETGLRRCELQGLRWSDFRLGAGGESPPDRPQAVASGNSATPANPVRVEPLPERVAHPSQQPLASVRVPASITKNRRTVVLSIGPELAAELIALRGPECAPFQLAFSGLVPRLPRFRKDLVAAGIPFVDDGGRRADLHALRKTFGTGLVLAGVEPRVVMEAMRHSDLKLTMKTYTDAALLVGPMSAAVQRLPWSRIEARRENIA